MAAPAAAICFPTRRRAGYLAVALASVAPQAAARGVEIVVVEDGPEDPPAARAAAAHGARYLALGAERGINAARNAAVDGTTGALVCLLDDDVEAWPGWLDAMLKAARDRPRHDAFGGPIPPRPGGPPPPAARGRPRGGARGAGSRSPSPRWTWVPPTATPSSPGARTSRCAAARSRAS